MSFMLPFTLHARSWEKAYIRVRKRLAVGQPIKVHPCDAQQFVRLIFSERHIIFGHAGYHATAAPRTFVQIDDHSEFMGLVVFHQNLVGVTVID
jgi:hypothetical protein